MSEEVDKDCIRCGAYTPTAPCVNCAFPEPWPGAPYDPEGKPKSVVGRDGKMRGTGRHAFPESKCLTPACELKFGGNNKKKGGRGLCFRCHQQASSLVRRGITTWKELESLGLAQPKYGSLVERELKLARLRKERSE